MISGNKFEITDIRGTVTLNNGVEMPYFGLGVCHSKEGEEVINAVNWALDKGYRHIDTAMIYGNETGVGEGIRRSSVDRKDVFVVSKVWNTDQGYSNTIKAFEKSLGELNMDYLDLYLVHWPVKGKYIETWKALEYLYKKGKIRAIGVSNFLKHHIEELLKYAEIVPAVNQMEFHPYLVQQDLLDFCSEKDIRYEAWSPIMRGKVFEIDTLHKLAGKYDKSVVQVVLRWDLQKGVITIPKSARKDRIMSNADIFDFEISKEDMDLIDSLDRHYRTGEDPDDF